MNRELPIPLEYFSDVLCVWAYVGDVRLVELERAFAKEIAVDCHFIDVFGDAHGKLGASWAERGGLPAYGAHVRHVVERFDHVSIHADVWSKCQPTSSMGCHILLAAVKLLDPTLFRATARALREAFFAEAIDISQRARQLEVAERVGLPSAELEAILASGRAHAELSRGQRSARRHGVEVSPTFVFDDGRERLQGNVGYRVLEANVRELLHGGEAGRSWC
ncbi:MAG: DsbA family protein [Sandaracinus sp.]|nr:DsbA family protein [Sandaracinus sp.]MCB9623657.1 DsbA family protein [Sandaracinus sp.]MCB9630690.1 DsbA family protein [Sandaracinus sp.]